MNLKEAFRFQNKLQSMMTDAQSILGNNGNITKVQNTYLRHKVMAEAEDEVTMEAPSTEYSENITEMAEFLLFLLDEREKLSAAIHQAKVSLPLGAGLDGEVSLNGKRQEIATLLRHMAGLRNGEVLIPNGGIGYRFNNEGNQVSYVPHAGYIDYGFDGDTLLHSGKYIKYPKNSNCQRWMKRETSRKFRNCQDLPRKGNYYRRLFDYWWTLY